MGKIPKHFYYERILAVNTGEPDGPCMNVRCGSEYRKPKATFFHKPTKAWICLGCAQKMNAQAARDKVSKEAISAQEYMVELLRK